MHFAYFAPMHPGWLSCAGALGHAAHDSSSSSSSVQDLKLTPKLEERLQKIAARAEDLGEQLSKGGTTVGGFSNVAALTREYGALRDVADKFQLLMAARKEVGGTCWAVHHRGYCMLLRHAQCQQQSGKHGHIEQAMAHVSSLPCV